MYQVIIADSKYQTTGKSKYNIDWNAEGFNVICIAETASEVMAFISNVDVDLVFTDMSFPDAKGYDLIKYIRYHCPYTKIVAVSDNTDFESVKWQFSFCFTIYESFC